MSDKLTKNDESPEQSPVHGPEAAPMFYEHRSMGEHVWAYIKSYADFSVIALKEEFDLVWRYKSMKWLYFIIAFIVVSVIGTFLGIPIIDLLKPIFNLLSLEWWIRIGLVAIILFLLLLVDGSRRFNERTVKELKDEHAREERRLKSERDTFTGLYNEERTNLITSHNEVIAELKRNHQTKIDEKDSETSEKNHEISELKHERYTLKEALTSLRDGHTAIESERDSLKSERDSLKFQLEELKKWKVTFEVGRESQVHYSHIEEMSHFTANLLIQFENKSEQDLTMYRVELCLYKQDESGEEKKLDFDIRNLKIEHYPKTSLQVNFSRGLKLIAGELSSPYLFRFDMEQLFIEELTADCFLRVTMFAMNQDPLSKDYIVDDWELIRSNSYISERHQEPSQNVIPSAFVASDLISDARAAEEERQELVRNLETLLKEGISKLRQADYSGAAFWEVEVKMRIEKGLSKWQAEEFSKETDIKVYPYPAMSRHRADMLYTLTERLGAIITELKKG